MKVAFLVRYSQLLSASWKNKTARRRISMDGAREKDEYFFLRLSSCLAYWHQAGHLVVIKFSCHSDIYKSESQYFFISLSYPLFICWRSGWGEERGKEKGEMKNGTDKEQNSHYLSSRKFLYMLRFSIHSFTH